MKSVIGLEVHVELKTKSKMFCGCPADYFGKKPNTHTCPVCLGLPGALPVPNKTAIQWCVMLGLALNCKIPLTSKFDRKNYFYPDLPKGYQISQYDEPFCLKGSLKLDNGKVIKIRRVHMEEDTGKLIHATVGNEDVSLIDLNRSGVPLVEIVTEPDFDNSKDVKEYLQKLQQIVRYLAISDADMEKGDMRLEPNISISKDGSLPSYKVEVKNINSFRFAEKAIDYEIKRQLEILKNNETPIQETRGWDEKKQKTVSQRTKEEASDYRYFPEPDIPPIRWTQKQLEGFRKQIPELPHFKVQKYENELKIKVSDAIRVSENIEVAQFFEKTVKIGSKHNVSPQSVANFLLNKGVNTSNITPAELIKTIISTSTYATIDNSKIKKAVEKVLRENPKALNDLRVGKTQTLQFLIGKTMAEIKEKIDTKIIIEEINRQTK
ncbi:MAG: Asp-tRNA(Asn)/Glu-tRNA(Gln) amidotransferase subunit GatB [Candidatus Levybacteria bacterium]|nr:Asp-tRNA(Asn)/Glu-tRNA(Gln) amidotransferase subunit GatB [Candidatus Levybacteria bacterium]